jgi:hypothetical protein
VFVERGVSGGELFGECQGGKALLAAVRPGDVVITPELDRMFRAALEVLGVLAKLKGSGACLHKIDLGAT